MREEERYDDVVVTKTSVLINRFLIITSIYYFLFGHSGSCTIYNTFFFIRIRFIRIIEAQISEN